MGNEAEKEILNKLSGIEKELTAVKCSVNSIEADNKRYQDWLEKHQGDIYGKDENKGLRTKVAALESAQERQTWLLRTALGGMIVSGIGWLMSLFGWGK